MLIHKSNGLPVFLFVAEVLLCVSTSAQAPGSHPLSPKKAAQILQEAAVVNGLLGDGVKPWHLEASYSFLDGDGNRVEQGTLEETWAGPDRDKLVVRRPAETLTYIRTEKGTYREGELDRKLALLLLVEEAFVRPIPTSIKWLSFQNITSGTRTMGSASMPCFTLEGERDTFSSYNDPTYCFEDKEPILRVGGFANEQHQFTRNNMGKFQGRFVPVDLIAGRGDKPDLTAHLEQLREIANVEPREFEPGPKAVLQRAGKTVLIFPEGTFDRSIETHHIHVIKDPHPELPAIAQAAHVRGHVVLRAAIDADGDVTSLNVIRGPAMLQEAALDAVWQWKFEPPLSPMGLARIIAIIDVSF